MTKMRAENSDAAGLITALLVRFPEIATIATEPEKGTVELAFVIERRVTADEARRFGAIFTEHVETLLGMRGEEPEALRISWEPSEAFTFIRVVRDTKSLSREELALVTAVLAERFGERLRHAAIADDSAEDDLALQDEMVDCALDALRDSSIEKGLVGLREEKRVVVYFQTARKKAKARARS